MPGWQVVVQRIGTILADPSHAAWRDERRAEVALAEMPSWVSSIEQLTEALLNAPSDLPLDVLAWLSRHLLYCAGPPYALAWQPG
jgi:hypothetical protein